MSLLLILLSLNLAGAAPVGAGYRDTPGDITKGDVHKFETERHCKECVDAEKELVRVLDEHDRATQELTDASAVLNLAIQNATTQKGDLDRKIGARDGFKTDVDTILKDMRRNWNNDKPQPIMDQTGYLKSKAEDWAGAINAVKTQQPISDEAGETRDAKQDIVDAKKEIVAEKLAPIKGKRDTARRECAEMRGEIHEVADEACHDGCPEEEPTTCQELFKAGGPGGCAETCSDDFKRAYLKKWEEEHETKCEPPKLPGLEEAAAAKAAADKAAAGAAAAAEP